MGELRHGEVHIWLMDLDAPAAGSGQPLDPAERERAASYLSPLDGARFAASRAGLRRILGRYLDADPAALRFATNPGGRPILAGQHGSHRAGLQFSLSRSVGVALLAISAGPVGTDIEAVVPRPGLPDLAAARFGPAEAGCIASGGCAESPLRSFYRHWTAREAWLKATGIGLAGLRDIELACRPAPAIRSRAAGRATAGLHLHLLDLSPAHAAAVAADGRVTTCRLLLPGRQQRYRGSGGALTS